METDYVMDTSACRDARFAQMQLRWWGSVQVSDVRGWLLQSKIEVVEARRVPALSGTERHQRTKIRLVLSSRPTENLRLDELYKWETTIDMYEGIVNTILHNDLVVDTMTYRFYSGDHWNLGNLLQPWPRLGNLRSARKPQLDLYFGRGLDLWFVSNRFKVPPFKTLKK